MIHRNKDNTCGVVKSHALVREAQLHSDVRPLLLAGNARGYTRIPNAIARRLNYSEIIVSCISAAMRVAPMRCSLIIQVERYRGNCRSERTFI